MTANKIKDLFTQLIRVTELSSITKWHVQFTLSYSVTAWPAVYIMCGCAWSSNFNHWKLSSYFLSCFPCHLFLSCFLSRAFLSSSVIFCLSGGFFILGMCTHIDLCCLCLHRTTERNSGKCSQCMPSKYKSFSTLPKLGMYAKARGRDWRLAQGYKFRIIAHLKTWIFKKFWVSLSWFLLWTTGPLINKDLVVRQGFW